MTLLRAFWDAAREVDPEAAANADEGIVMHWCGEGELAELWRSAGLREVRFGPLVVRASYSDFEDLWAPFPSPLRARTGTFVPCAFRSSNRDDAARASGDPDRAAARPSTGVDDGEVRMAHVGR